jgi:hypothetical protein
MVNASSSLPLQIQEILAHLQQQLVALLAASNRDRRGTLHLHHHPIIIPQVLQEEEEDLAEVGALLVLVHPAEEALLVLVPPAEEALLAPARDHLDREAPEALEAPELDPSSQQFPQSTMEVLLLSNRYLLPLFLLPGLPPSSSRRIFRSS